MLGFLRRKITFRTTRIKMGIGTTDCTEGRLFHTTFGRLVRSGTLAKDGKTPVTHFRYETGRDTYRMLTGMFNFFRPCIYQITEDVRGAEGGGFIYDCWE